MNAPRVKPKLMPIARCMAGIEEKTIRWLWRDRIPNKAVLLAGHPGLGKSQISIAMAATVSTGGKWPDHTPCEIGSVVFIAAEDDAADTVKPRLAAAGADMSKVHILDGVMDEQGDRRSWDLKDIDVLTDLCAQHGDVRLIIVDPITAYMGSGTDGHSTTDVRGQLEPLMQLADNINATVLMISHLNKSGGSEAMTRVTGSMAFVAAARAAFVVAKHPEHDDVVCMATLKHNVSPQKTAVTLSTASLSEVKTAFFAHIM